MHTKNNREGQKVPTGYDRSGCNPTPTPFHSFDNFPEPTQSGSSYVEDNTIFGFNIVETIISFLCQDDDFPWSHIRSLTAFLCSVPGEQKNRE